MAGTKDKLPSRDEIAKRAYEIYVQRGRENGTERDNWVAAEKELLKLSSAPEQHPVLNYSGNQPNHEPTFMLLDFFGLREQPFGMTPDPAYLYASDTHRDALSALKFGVAENRGFFALIAQPGMGKTTLLYRLLEDLHDSARTVLVSQTQCNPGELIAYILHELGVESEGMGLVTMHGKLNEILFNELLAGRRFVLVVDEAQNLDDSVLETVRMLSNFETHNAKLVQIILAGQPRLAAKLAQPRLIQLRQRIAVVCHLEPFTAKETASYIAHRLSIAGHSGEPIFDSGALDEIATQSDGIPRNINNICFNSMLAAFHRGQRTVSAEIVRKAVSSLDLEALISKPVKIAELVAPQAVAPVSAPAIALVSAPQKGWAVEIAPAFVPAVQEITAPEPTVVQPLTFQKVAAPQAVPMAVDAPQQGAVSHPAAIVAVQPRQIATPEPTPALVPAPQESVVAEAAPISVMAPPMIAAPEPTAAPVSAAANVATPVVAATPVVPVYPAVTAPVSTAIPTAASVSASVSASVPAPAATLPFRPLPKSAQTAVTAAPKKGRAATDFISYEDYKKRSLKRWQIRSVIVTAILLSAILALAILGRSQSKRGITPHSFDSSSGSIVPLGSSISSDNGSSSYDAAPRETNDGVILTVAAGANESIRDLSLRYVGRFDSNLSRQILVLNPDLKDPDHLQDGQLVRIPLPAGALKKMNDTGEAASGAGNPEESDGLLGKIDALLRGQK
jgi:general secretion pathway protein A